MAHVGSIDIARCDRCGKVYAPASAPDARAILFDDVSQIDLCSDECLIECAGDGGLLADGSRFLLLFRKRPCEIAGDVDRIVDAAFHDPGVGLLLPGSAVLNDATKKPPS